MKSMQRPLAALAQGWAQPTPALRRTTLLLDAERQGADDAIANLSAAVRVGDTLFLGSDEGSSIERLQRVAEGWAGHSRVALADLLELESADEADIEGLAEDDGWLWVLGSHARTRPKIGKDGDDRIDLDAFSNLKDTRPRCLLARLPIVADPANPKLFAPMTRDGERRAGIVKQTKRGNAIAAMLARDPLLSPFTYIPAKEGGVDLEGIAVAGSRVAIGMRGPVIQTYAMLLEMEVTSRRSGRLKVSKTFFRRLLDLDGLGIRDLKRVGTDLLILAGPTTGLDGPCAVYRWRGWTDDPARHDAVVCLHRPERITELPFGRGNDHPEGLAILEHGAARELLVICDSPSPSRIDKDKPVMTCDIFSLPT
jgi:hypothetical protein